MLTGKYVCFLIYLFAYLQVSPAVAQNFQKRQISHEDNKELSAREARLLRPKRFIGAIIAIITAIVTGAIAGIIAGQVNKVLDNSDARSGDRTTNIDIVINNNYGNAAELKKNVERTNGRAGRAIELNPGGFYCDHNFCRRFGDGQNSLGLCSPDICHCSNGNPFLQQCGTGTVFDPLYKVCNWPSNVRICGN